MTAINTRSAVIAWDTASTAAQSRQQPVAVLSLAGGYSVMPLTVADLARVQLVQAENRTAYMLVGGTLARVDGIARPVSPVWHA